MYFWGIFFTTEYDDQLISIASCVTLPETNSSPENRPEFSDPTIHFQVRTVSFREGTCLEIGFWLFHENLVGGFNPSEKY